MNIDDLGKVEQPEEHIQASLDAMQLYLSTKKATLLGEPVDGFIIIPLMKSRRDGVDGLRALVGSCGCGVRDLAIAHKALENLIQRYVIDDLIEGLFTKPPKDEG